MVTEVCMFFLIFFLTVLTWRMSKRIEELELHDKAQWETISRLCEEIRANRKRVAALEGKDGDHHD